MIEASRFATVVLWTSVAVAAAALAAVVFERAAFTCIRIRHRRIQRRYEPLIQRALAGDDAAAGALAICPGRHRPAVARMLVEPLIADRRPARIARTRVIAHQLSLVALADRYLRSAWWWRRALALRALGLVQVRERTPAIIASLDDPRPHVRAAALDALTDMHDPAALAAVVVRFHDPSLHRGRRAAALTAFGSDSEPFLHELAKADTSNRVNYARALAMCGTHLSRPVLAGWTRDSRPDVRAAAFEALARIGVDEFSAALALEALDTDEEPVRAMAAFALQGWTGAGNAATQLARHLDDVWPVAIRAARSLRSMGPGGLSELQANASRPDLAGVLARQMLWSGAMEC
jgi:HEAT repeat protein